MTSLARRLREKAVLAVGAVYAKVDGPNRFLGT